MTEGPHRTTEEWKQSKLDRRARQQQLFEARHVYPEADAAVPFVGNEYVCPNCHGIIPTRLLRTLNKPPQYAHLLNDVIRCAFCDFVFSYRGSHLRTARDDEGKETGTVMSG